MVLNSQKDTTSQTTQVKMFKKLLKEAGLLDIWRDLLLSEQNYTYYSALAVHSRIDYFFYYLKNDIEYRTALLDLWMFRITLHCTYLTPRQQTQENYLAVKALLNNKVILEQIKSEIKCYIDNNNNCEVSPVILWDGLKAVIRAKAMKKNKGA